MFSISQTKKPNSVLQSTNISLNSANSVFLKALYIFTPVQVIRQLGFVTITY